MKILLLIILLFATPLEAAVLCNADTEYINIADNAKWDLSVAPSGGAKGTISAWVNVAVYPNVNGEYSVIFKARESTADDYFSVIFLQTSGLQGTMFQLTDNGSAVAYIYKLGAVPSAGTWHHLVITFNTSDAAGNQIYYDNVSQSATSASWGDDTFTISPNQIWTCGDGVNIDDDITVAHLAYFNDVLTTTEITALFNNPWSAKDHVDLVAYFPMHEGAGTNVNDFSGTSTDGTLTNSPTWATGPAKRRRIF